MKHQKVLLAAAGTAGHINPALALANQLEKRNISVRFLGCHGIEEELIPLAGYELFQIEKTPLIRDIKSFYKNFALPKKLQTVLSQVIKYIKDEQISAVVGFGGYVSLPAYLAAYLLKIPIIIHEQNVKVGLANKIGAKFCQYFGYSFNNTKLPKCLVDKKDEQSSKTDNIPISKHIGLPIYREASKKQLRPKVSNSKSQTEILNNLKKNGKKNILVFGGSLGAKSINEVVYANSSAICEKANIIHITGKGKKEDLIKSSNIKVPSNYQIFEYSKEIIELMKMVDLVIARSGAGTCHEIASAGVASVLVPLPHGNGEQKLNAEMLEDGAIVVDDSAFNVSFVIDELLPLLDDDSKLKMMSNTAQKYALDNADITLAKAVDKILADEMIKKYRKVHFMAISGAGMNPISTCFQSFSEVSGCDNDIEGHNPSHIISQKIKKIGDKKVNLPSQDALIYSSAIKKHNSELKCAVEMERVGLIDVMHRSDALNLLSRIHSTSIAVAGSHGKTTITAMIASILDKVHPTKSSFVIGARSFVNDKSTNGGKLSDIRDFIVYEADESDGSFVKYHPDIAVVSNIEPDHLDNYKTFDNVIAAFMKFMSSANYVVITPEVLEVLKKHVSEEELSSLKNLKVIDINQKVLLNVPGQYNQINALLALEVSKIIKIKEHESQISLSAFRGAERRFDIHNYEINISMRKKEKEAHLLTVVDDYAHHPTEVQKLISAAKEKYFDSKIITLFQPHLFSRTENFAKEFAKEIAKSNVGIITKIYPARETQKQFPDVTPKTISSCNRRLKFTESLEDGVSMALDSAVNFLKKDKSVVILTVGAGDTLIPQFEKMIEEINSK